MIAVAKALADLRQAHRGFVAAAPKYLVTRPYHHLVTPSREQIGHAHLVLGRDLAGDSLPRWCKQLMDDYIAVLVYFLDRSKEQLVLASLFHGDEWGDWAWPWRLWCRCGAKP